MIKTTDTVTPERPHKGTLFTVKTGLDVRNVLRGTVLPIFMPCGITARPTGVRISVTAFDRDRATGFAAVQGRPPREVLC